MSYIGDFTVANVSIGYFYKLLCMQYDVIETSLVNTSQIHNYSPQLTINVYVVRKSPLQVSTEANFCL